MEVGTHLFKSNNNLPLEREELSIFTAWGHVALMALLTIAALGSCGLREFLVTCR